MDIFHFSSESNAQVSDSATNTNTLLCVNNITKLHYHLKFNPFGEFTTGNIQSGLSVLPGDEESISDPRVPL